MLHSYKFGKPEREHLMKNFTRIFLALPVIVTLTACAGISLVDSWKDAGASPKHYRKLLVVGIADKSQMRQVFEEVFASEVRKSGASAVPSYTITGAQGKPTRASLEEAVRKSGADGVITTRLVSLKRDTDVRTGFVMTDRGYSNSRFNDAAVVPADLYGFYGTTVSYASYQHQSVDVTISTVATIETNLFDAGTGRLVWSGTTSAVKPEGIITVSNELAQVVIRAMIREGLI
jgi:hypothetical protein